MNRLKQLLHVNDEMAVTIMVMAIFWGWFGVMYMVVHNFMDAMTFTIVPIVLVAMIWMAVQDLKGDL